MNPNAVSIGIFCGFVVVTLAITAWAQRQSKSASNFYAAGGEIGPWQNGLAIAGDYLSAASFLGSIALFWQLGIDGLFYAVGAAAGWPLLMCLTAERLRTLGQYTFADVLCRRLSDRPVRTLTTASTLCICGTYLIAQIVGAGALIQVLFGLPYEFAVVLIGSLMMIYVIFGGMIATTWIQIVKASVLIITVLFMVVVVLVRFDFSLPMLAAAAAAERGGSTSLLQSNGLLKDSFSAIGLALAFALGPAGMPHVLMRFFTVRDANAARRSLVVASTLIVGFQLMVIVLGYGAIAYVRQGSQYTDAQGALLGGTNMAAVHLAHNLGGSVLLGIVAAVAFATILAVVSGLTLAAAAAVSRDFYNGVLRAGRADEAAELRVARYACLVIGIVSIVLGILFRDQNVGFLATLPLVIGASANFTILLLAMYWPGLTTAGAVCGGTVGLVLSVVLILFSPKVWVQVFGHAQPLFPYDYPTLLSVPAAFITAWIVSIVRPEVVPSSSLPRSAA